MMFRPTLLLWGAIVITAVPVLADKIPYTDIEKESPVIESPLKAAHHPDLSLNALLVSAFSAEAVALIDNFEAYDASAEEQPNVEFPAKVTRRSGLEGILSVNAESLPEFTPELALHDPANANDFFDFGVLRFAEPKSRFFRSLPGTNLQAASVSQVDSHQQSSFVSHVWETWRTEGQGIGRNGGDKNPKRNGLVPAVAVIPEPGSLSFLLFGFAAVGFLGRRRGELRTAT
jgi:hypothetical protein